MAVWLVVGGISIAFIANIGNIQSYLKCVPGNEHGTLQGCLQANFGEAPDNKTNNDLYAVLEEIRDKQ